MVHRIENQTRRGLAAQFMLAALPCERLATQR
jgi:hypothetical protein